MNEFDKEFYNELIKNGYTKEEAKEIVSGCHGEEEKEEKKKKPVKSSFYIRCYIPENDPNAEEMGWGNAYVNIDDGNFYFEDAYYEGTEFETREDAVKALPTAKELAREQGIPYELEIYEDD